TAERRIFLCVCGQPVFEARVIGVDNQNIACFIEEYFCGLVGFLNSCYPTTFSMHESHSHSLQKQTPT
ncbi:MAG: hypothetical protein IJW51_07305, partial [Clostridia bacterium]|nr:hypothetical protein [Clostridia bacterium]